MTQSWLHVNVNSSLTSYLLPHHVTSLICMSVIKNIWQVYQTDNSIVCSFWAIPPSQNFTGNSLSERYIHADGKKCDFWPNRCCFFSQKPIVTTDHKQEVIDNWSVSVPVTMKGGTWRVQFFWCISVIMLIPFDLERPYLARGEGRISRVSATPPAKGRRPSVSIFVTNVDWRSEFGS